MNLRVLKKARRPPQVGDVFAMLPPDGDHLFGRVVSVDAAVGAFRPCILVYIYRARASRKEEVPRLDPSSLLMPPVMTNRLPWSLGYFETVGRTPMGDGERLHQHCFRDLRGWYFDEYSNRILQPVEPIGEWGLDSVRTIDDKVSKALGIPLAPDE